MIGDFLLPICQTQNQYFLLLKKYHMILLNYLYGTRILSAPIVFDVFLKNNIKHVSG